MGLYWSIHTRYSGDRKNTLALGRGRDGEEEVFATQDDIVGAAVSPDGRTVCLAGPDVKILRPQSRGSKVLYSAQSLQRELRFSATENCSR